MGVDHLQKRTGLYIKIITICKNMFPLNLKSLINVYLQSKI